MIPAKSCSEETLHFMLRMKDKGAMIINSPPINNLNLLMFTFFFSSSDAVLYPAISMSPFPESMITPSTNRTPIIISAMFPDI